MVCTWVHLFIAMSCTLASTTSFYFHNVPWHLSLAGVQFVSWKIHRLQFQFIPVVCCFQREMWQAICIQELIGTFDLSPIFWQRMLSNITDFQNYIGDTTDIQPCYVRRASNEAWPELLQKIPLKLSSHSLGANKKKYLDFSDSST